MEPRRSAALAVALLLLTGCSATAAVGSNDTRYVSGDGSTIILSIKERVTLPVLTGTTLTGSALSLSQYAGKVMVLNVWASWCPPCRAEAPTLQRVSQQLAARGVVFVGIDTRDNVVAGSSYVANFGITYPSLFDQDGRLLLQFRGTLPPAAIPSTIVIDRHGRVAARALGGVDESRLLGLVEPVLQEAS
jgi:thiol-disulfide isomerase/thioredoxin